MPQPPKVNECVGINEAARRVGVESRTIRYAVETESLRAWHLADGRPVVWLRDLDRWNKKRGQ